MVFLSVPTATSRPTCTVACWPENVVTFGALSTSMSFAASSSLTVGVALNFPAGASMIFASIVTCVSRSSFATCVVVEQATTPATSNTPANTVHRFNGPRLHRSSTMARTRRSSVDGCAIVTAHCPAKRATWHNNAAYSSAGAPLRNTVSSHACSCASRSDRAASQTSGFGQYTAHKQCATSRVGQSRRSTCASSWRNAVSRFCSGHANAALGSITTGRQTPHVNGTAHSGECRHEIPGAKRGSFSGWLRRCSRPKRS